MVGITPAAGTCTHIPVTVSASHINLLGNTQVVATTLPKSKDQLSNISHGLNIFALTLVRDATLVYLEGPRAYIPQTIAVRESSAVDLVATD